MNTAIHLSLVGLIFAEALTLCRDATAVDRLEASGMISYGATSSVEEDGYGFGLGGKVSLLLASRWVVTARYDHFFGRHTQGSDLQPTPPLYYSNDSADDVLTCEFGYRWHLSDMEIRPTVGFGGLWYSDVFIASNSHGRQTRSASWPVGSLGVAVLYPIGPIVVGADVRGILMLQVDCKSPDCDNEPPRQDGFTASALVGWRWGW